MREGGAATGECSVLIVDDDPSAIQLIRRALSEHSDVRFATNGKDALRLARVRAPDLILLDGEMPGEHGIEVCRRLKADPDLREIPIIFITANDDILFETQALELGAADFLAKPISGPRVRLRVRLHLQLKRQLDQLRALARTDGLTQLANRRSLDEALAREWRRAQRTGSPLSFLLIDVDFFKAFNDAYGHPAGDECLKAVAAAIATAARRPSDLTGRFGGEEFAMVLADTPSAGARHVAKQVNEAVARLGLPHRASSVAGHITVSVGISSWEGPLPAGRASRASVPFATDAAELVEAADRALYLAKQRGRNRVEFVPLRELPLTQHGSLPDSQAGVVSAPGAGSQLWGYVPFAQTPEHEHGARDVRAGASSDSPLRLTGVRLLVVDDSDINRDIAAQILQLEGAEVATADDGEEAVQRVLTAERAFDAVLMDVQMPRVDGIEAARRIRGAHPQTELPIIALTAGALASERQQALGAGMDDVVSKPLDPEMLIDSVRFHVERVRGVPLGIAAPRVARRRKGEWSRVEGIDADDAYVRLGGDARLFRSLLARLVSALEELQRSLSLPVRASLELAAHMHKLRGMAGNLGARDLHAVAGEVEASLRGERTADLQQGVARLLVECDRVGRSARALIRASLPSASPTQGEAARALDAAALATLIGYLREQDLRAFTLFSKLSSALAQRLGAAEHARLGAAVEGLDFATAADLVAKLAVNAEARTSSKAAGS